MLLMLPASTHRQNRSSKAPKATQERPVPADPKLRRWLTNLWKKRGLKWGALLLAVTLCALAARRPKFPNATGQIAARLEVGMSYDNAIAVLREHEPGAGVFLYLRGRTHDGHEFISSGWRAFHDLPPAHKVAWAEFNVMDDYSGRELYITIEPRAGATELRLESSSIWEELRYGLAYKTGWSGWKSLTRERHACFERFFSAD